MYSCSHTFPFLVFLFFCFSLSHNSLTPHSSSSGAGRQGLLHVPAITLSPDCHHTGGGGFFSYKLVDKQILHNHCHDSTPSPPPTPLIQPVPNDGGWGAVMKNYTSQSAGQSYSWLCIMLTSHNHCCCDRGRDVERGEKETSEREGKSKGEQMAKGEENNMIEKDLG